MKKLTVLLLCYISLGMFACSDIFEPRLSSKSALGTFANRAQFAEKWQKNIDEGSIVVKADLGNKLKRFPLSDDAIVDLNSSGLNEVEVLAVPVYSIDSLSFINFTVGQNLESIMHLDTTKA